MQIVCPHCNFTKEIDETKLPPGAKRATCPKCREKFDLFPKTEQAASPPPPPLMDDSELEEITPPPAMEMQTPPPPPQPEMQTPPPPPQQPVSSSAGYQTPPMPPKGFGAPVPKGIPWEERKGTLIGDLWATWKMVMFSPGDFFDRLPVDNGFKGPLTFSIICCWVGGIILALFGGILGALFGATGGGGFMGGLLYLVIAVVMAIILIPIYMALNLFVGSAIYHLFLMIVGGAKNGYQATVRTMGYSYAPFAFFAVPYLGMMVGGIYALVLAIIGLPKTQETTILKVVLAIIVIPIALGIILMIVFGIIAALVIPSLTNM